VGEVGNDRGQGAHGKDNADAGHAAGVGVDRAAAAAAAMVGALGPSLSRSEEAAAMAHGWGR
jgi:hypothetical protein